MQADNFKPSGVNLAHADAIVAIGNAEQIGGYIGTWPSDPNPDFELVALAMLRNSVKAKDRARD